MDKLRKGWEQHLLGELFEFKNGLNTDKSKYGAGCKFVNVMDVFNNDYLIEDKIIGSVQITEKQLFEYKLKYGDVLFNRTSEVPEEIAYSTVYLDDKDAVFGGFVIRARAITDKLNEKFLIYLFQSDKFRTQVIKCGQGAIRANIGQKDLAKIKMEIPPLPEQIKIAEILSTWDNAIQTTEKQLANSQQQKKALMQMLLSGEKRVAGFSGEWCECYLSEIAYITTGSSNRQDSSSEGEYTFFDRSEDIRKSNIYLFDKEAVIVAGEGQQFTPKYFVGKFDLHQRTYAIMDFQLCVGKFIYYLIDFKKDYFLSQAVGSTVKSLRLPMFQKMKLMLPKSIEEQQKIAEILTTADQEIETLQKKLECLKLEKRALMQKLL